MVQIRRRDGYAILGLAGFLAVLEFLDFSRRDMQWLVVIYLIMAMIFIWVGKDDDQCTCKHTAVWVLLFDGMLLLQIVSLLLWGE